MAIGLCAVLKAALAKHEAVHLSTAESRGVTLSSAAFANSFAVDNSNVALSKSAAFGLVRGVIDFLHINISFFLPLSKAPFLLATAQSLTSCSALHRSYDWQFSCCG